MSLPEEPFNQAFDVFKTEFHRLLRERVDELSKSLIRLATSPDFQRLGNQFVPRQQVYQESAEAIGNDFISCIKNIILPHCDLISDEQLQTLRQEFRKVISSKIEQAKSGTQSFAASIGLEGHSKSAVSHLESRYHSIASRFDDLIVSVVRQSNLSRIRSKATSPSEVKVEGTKLERYKRYFTDNKVLSLVLIFGLVIVGLANFTDSIDKLTKLFPTSSKPFADPVVVVIDAINQNSTPIEIDPLCEFYITEDRGLSIDEHPKGRANLRPLSSDSTYSQYILPAQASRSFFITLPNLALYSSLLERGDASIHLFIFKARSRQFGTGSIAFQLDYIEKYRAKVVIDTSVSRTLE